MIYLEIFAILIVLIAMTWVKHNGFRIGMAKAREKDEENRKKRKAITKNMNFFETYNYLLQKKNGKDLKLQNQTRTTLYIAFFLSIIMVVGYSIAHKSFNIFFAIIAVIGITFFACSDSFENSDRDTSNALAIASKNLPVPAAHLSFMAKFFTVPSVSIAIPLTSCPPISIIDLTLGSVT